MQSISVCENKGYLLMQQVSQTTLKAHWSKYMQDAAKGAEFRIKGHDEKHFAVLCGKVDSSHGCVAVKEQDAKKHLSDVCKWVKEGHSFRLVSQCGTAVYMKPCHDHKRHAGDHDGHCGHRKKRRHGHKKHGHRKGCHPPPSCNPNWPPL